MAEIAVSYERDRWTCDLDDAMLVATNPIWENGAIRCMLSTARNGELLYRDKINLTSGGSRRLYIGRLSDLGLDVQENVFIAMDEAIRRTPKKNSKGGTHPLGVDIADKVIGWDEFIHTVRQWLLLDDVAIIKITFGAVIGHRLGGESPWLMLIAPPSGTKTEILRMLWHAPWAYPLSELTDKTFASGLDIAGEDPSLLARLEEEVLIFKDFTTVLEMRRESRQAILAQLREIYDGHYDKVWGTGKELHWSGRLGFIAGVTEVIDQHHAVMAVLGPRFLLYRPDLPDRQGVAIRSLENAQHDEEMRRELATAAMQFLNGVPLEPPEIDEEARVWLAKVADLVTKARSAVVRDRYRREIEFVPQPELPARLARQLHALLQGVTAVSSHEAAQPDDLNSVARVAWDCIPAVRRKALDVLFKADGMLKTSDAAEEIQTPTVTVRRALEDLQVLRLVDVEKGGPGKADLYRLRDETRESMEALRLVEPTEVEGAVSTEETDEQPAQSPSVKPNGAIQEDDLYHRV